MEKMLCAKHKLYTELSIYCLSFFFKSHPRNMEKEEIRIRGRARIKRKCIYREW
jgi:hypothetical protein